MFLSSDRQHYGHGWNGGGGGHGGGGGGHGGGGNGHGGGWGGHGGGWEGRGGWWWCKHKEPPTVSNGTLLKYRIIVTFVASLFPWL